MDELGLTVEGEYYRLILGKERIIFDIGKSVRMLGVVYKLHKVYDIYEAYLNLGKILTENGNSRKGFLGGRITAACKHYIWFLSGIIACPVPDTYTLGTMLNCLLHCKPLMAGMLTCYYNVNVVLTPYAVIEA